MNKKIVIFGATSTIAEHCSRIWVESEAVDVILVGRNKKALNLIKNDLIARNKKAIVSTEVIDMTNVESVENCISKHTASGNIDIALIAHGVLPEQDLCQNNIDSIDEIININATSHVIIGETLAKVMEKQHQGTIAFIGSVAGDRGRKSNYIYGATKAMVEIYTQGLRHRLHSSNVNVLLVKPGPTDTKMTKHLKNKIKNLAAPESVARLIVDAISKRKDVVYTPTKWKLIMFIVRNLPNFLFHKTNL
ncbi:SDR family NAD(P)-dependent oxidoreductase [Vibrio cholerae]|uniref:SDR family NAD(P)-dependent oxidoreductase n=1 Tax=Vibrio cholerae TaxID=666 RepID=UPI001C30AC45